MRGSAVFRTGVAPGGALAGPWVRDPLWTRARAVPSLDLRFADNKSLVDATTGSNLVTFTRASSGTFVGSDGVLQTAATDVPRFDHNPTTGESLGLLVEEQRTNSIRNNTMVGAVAGTPGTLPTNWAVASSVTGLSSQIIGTGTESGITYIDIKWTGTPSGNGTIQHLFESNTNTAAASGQSWTDSVYQRLVDGVAPGITSLLVVERSAANAFLASTATNATAIDSALVGQRITHTRTLNNASTAFVNMRLDVTVVSGVAIDFTIRIGLPQLEQGAFATSPIPTTTAAATRSADVCSITGSAFSGWYSQNEGTVFVETQLTRQNALAGAAMCGIETGVANTESIYMHYRGSGLTAAVIYDNSVLQLDQSPYGTAVPANTIVRQAIAVRLNDSASAGGGVAQATDTACTPPTPDRLLIGFSTAGNAYLSGTIRRLAFWGQRLPNNVLQQITQ